jgi:diphthamide biosynthesis enzyme Dph1/Dph2-like protein
MKVFLIKAKARLKGNLKILLAELKSLTGKFGKVCVLYPIQFSELCKKIEKSIGKKAKARLCFSQMVGCVLPCKADAYVYVGDGLFHPLSIAKLQMQQLLEEKLEKAEEIDFRFVLKPIYVFNPLNNSFFSLQEQHAKEIEKLVDGIKARWLKFNLAKSYGIIVSIKPGQKNMKVALEIKRLLLGLGKKAYLFLADTIREEELANFNIDFWINTACPNVEMPGMCNAREFFVFYRMLAHKASHKKEKANRD